MPASASDIGHSAVGKAKLVASLSVGKSEGSETKIKIHSLRAMRYALRPLF